MDSNTHSTQPPGPPPGGQPEWLAALAVAVDGLATQDLNRLPDPVVAQRVLRLRGLLDRLEGHWLHQLAAGAALGAAGAEAGQQAGSTPAWLRNQLHLRTGTGTATRAVRTARALFRGPLTAAAAAQAVTEGELSPAPRCWPPAPTPSPTRSPAEAEPVLVQAARQLDPTRLRRLLGHLLQLANPEAADQDRAHRPARRGLWLAPALRAWSRWTGCWNPKPARPSWPPWNP